MITESMEQYSSYMKNPSTLPYTGKERNLKYMQEIIRDIIQLSEAACSKSGNEAGIAAGNFNHKAFLIKSIVIISNNLSDKTFDFKRFASDMNLSKSTLYRRLQNLTDTSPYELILFTRMKYAQLFLSDSSLQITEIASMVGFNCPKHFSHTFRNRFELTPKAYRQKILLLQSDTAQDDSDKLLIRKATKLIESNISDSDYRLNHLALELGLSYSSLYRRIKMITGLSPVRFIRSVKLNDAKIRLRQNSGKVPDIAYESGFSDARYFSKCFRSEFGILPKEVIKNEYLAQLG